MLTGFTQEPNALDLDGDDTIQQDKSPCRFGSHMHACVSGFLSFLVFLRVYVKNQGGGGGTGMRTEHAQNNIELADVEFRHGGQICRVLSSKVCI